MSRIIMATALALAVTLPSVQAQAQNGSLTRSFVSSTGVDTNPCTITQPCASFAHAYTAIGANGIIAALDPGKYGPLIISGPVTINGNGWAAITAPAQGNGVTINAISGNVILTGLEIDGTGAVNNGIVFNSGSSLTVTDCVLRNFAYSGSGSANGIGIWLQPTSGTINFVITNTIVSDNGFIGIFYLPPSGSTVTAALAMDHVVTINNSSGGISADSFFTSGSTTVAISNSIANYNSVGIGVSNGSAPIAASIDNTSIIGNGAIGLYLLGTPKLYLGRSVITANGTGVQNNTSPNSVYSYQNNSINGNGTGTADDVAGSSPSLNSLALR